MEIYLVGGAVRDRLLNRPSHEKDWVVVGSTPAEMLSLGYRQVGKDFPVFIHPETGEEYALARTERKTGRGYTAFTCYAAPDVTLEEDLLRRDITINAIAMSSDGRLIDPYHGAKDLQDKVIRHVSPAFVEDPVRILRVARFKARFNFQIAEETQQLMLAMVRNGEVDALVPERVWQECEKALQEADAPLFFKALRECGALAVLFPAINQLFGVPNPVQHHPEIDSGIHALQVLQQAVNLSPSSATRFAALCHDFGKGITPPSEWPSHHGHEARGVGLIKDLCRRYPVPREYRDLALLVCRYHGLVHQALSLKPNTLLKLLLNVDAFRRPQRFQEFLTACLADARGRPGFEQSPYPQMDYCTQALQVASEVAIQPLLEQGLRDQALGAAIQQARLNTLLRFVRDYRNAASQ